MTAVVYELRLPEMLGLLILGGCIFVAGWIVRGEHDLYLRATGKHRRRRSRDLTTRTPW